MGWLILIAYLAFINWFTYREYSYDKHAARYKVWRTSERNLIRLAMFGGTPAAIYACKKFRHKTKKQSFRLKLYFVAAVQLIVLVLLLVS